MSSETEASSGPPTQRLSCTTCFDALWFCYFHQMQQYYRLGVLDNCSEKWNAVLDCLNLKTKRSAEVQEILETREKAKPHIWTFRTQEAASSNWKEQFGHLDEME
ncbi:hypothetical protein I3760_13G140400 [Carya illinoinensis]|uniref:uncharacterized protein LOC122293030 isoform X2 n=1 Tax=Carya illinoinensis TaxID=32201 RepID=UPI001BF79AA1|nr:uncharacterized protein LOC122293030 isoform X2 [Carya illinoinensis]XP_042957578.1 uncharacterized protein LOC122293030 isoform X2 [Carya illinoinensis]KAG2674512.1 hypothetical protein I3760_13G140400 [Carya illinoinensis]